MRCSESFVEFVQKCLWKMTRGISAHIAKLDMNPILEACNSFMNSYPKGYWGSQPSDKPLRTVKTIIAALVQHAADRVYVCLNLTPPYPRSSKRIVVENCLLSTVRQD